MPFDRISSSPFAFLEQESSKMNKIVSRQRSFPYFWKLNLLLVSFEFFISKRFVQIKTQDKKVSKPIILISVLSITLAIVVNLITVAIVTGFQNEIRKKVTGFNAPLFISKTGSSSIYECEPFKINKNSIAKIKNIEGVKGVTTISYKPALFQSSKFLDTIKLVNGKDSLIQRQEISGVMMKGVPMSYDWEFIQKHLVKGRIPRYNKNSISNEIIVSEKICNSLNYSVSDEVSCFYVKNQPVSRRYKIVGVFNTGLEEYDKKIVFCDLREVQRLNDYGITSSIEIDDTLQKSNSILIKAQINGGGSNLMYDWGKGADIYSGFYLSELKDTLIRLITYTVNYTNNKLDAQDTSYLSIDVTSPLLCNQLSHDETGLLQIQEIDSDTYNLESTKGNVSIKTIPGKGNSENYIAGYEVFISDWRNLDQIEKNLKNMLEMRPDSEGQLIQVKSILDNESDLFAWLSFLDFNVYIIIMLMLVIGVINVGSAMLVIIVLRTNLIGILKAMGATNWSIRKIFLYQAAYLICKGLFYGNLIGISLCWVQSTFGIIALNPTIYYIDKVPMELTIFNWMAINLITFFVCIASLIIPSYVVTSISPTKAINFN